MDNNTQNRDSKIRQDMAENFEILSMKNTLSPRYEALKIVVIYMAIGFLWIVLSDNVIRAFVKSSEFRSQIEIYKGWFYVGITGMAFYGIIIKRLYMFESVIDKSIEGYNELGSAYEELIAMESEIADQYKKIKTQEKGLRKEKEFSENIVSESPVLIIILDKSFNLKRMNPFAEKVTGYFAEDILGKNVLDIFIPQADKKEMTEQISGFVNRKYGRNKEFSVYKKDKSEFAALWNANQIHGNDGEVEGYIFIGVDISERRVLEKKLNRLAYYDSLTDLPNRVLLEKHFSKMIGEVERLEKKMAFIYMDIDNFKNINDTMGHTMGDTFISSIAEILSDMVKYPNMVARLSGDEFAILLTGVECEDDVKKCTDDIISKFKQSWILDNQEFFLSTSIGVAMYPEHGESIETLLQNSDTAMFHVKEHGKDGAAFYRPDMRDKTWEYIFMSSHLRNAIVNRELFMVYQPQVDLRTGEITGVEGLIRWIHPERGFISPADFIPFAEKTGYIKEITDWTLDISCNQIEMWRNKGYSGFKVSVNLSSKLLNQPGLVESIKERLERYRVEPKHFCLEITETAIIDNLERSIETLNEFKEIGVSVALDDFGTGYSSLTYLHKLPIDILKVDREFLVDIVDADHESYMFKSIMELAHNMGLKVIAEGIETEGQANFLKKANCDFAQGYYFGRPISVEELEKLLDRQKKSN